MAAEVEPGLANILVQLYRVVDGQEVNISNIFTDDLGLYSFADLDEGTYFLQFEIPQGFVASPPDQIADELFDSDIDAGGRTDNFDVAGNNVEGVNAGMYFDGCAGDAGQMPSEALALCEGDQNCSSSSKWSECS